IDVAADVSLGGVSLIGHIGSPSISISNCAIAWRDVVSPSSRTGFKTRELFLRVSCYQFSFWHGKTFLRVYIERPRSNHALSNWSGMFEWMEAPVSPNRFRDGDLEGRPLCRPLI